MKAIVGAFLVIVALVGAVSGSAVMLCGRVAEARAIFFGAAAGGILALAGLPFFVLQSRVKSDLESIKRDGEGQFWSIYGSGLLVRLFLLGVMGSGLLYLFWADSHAAMLAMIGVYLTGFCAEVVWLARVLSRNLAVAN